MQALLSPLAVKLPLINTAPFARNTDLCVIMPLFFLCIDKATQTDQSYRCVFVPYFSYLAYLQQSQIGKVE